MTEEPHDAAPDYDRLIDRYVDGELSADETTLLEQWLDADDAHVDQFAKQTFLHRQLRDQLNDGPPVTLTDLPSADTKAEPPEVKADTMRLLSRGATRRSVGTLIRRNNSAVAVAVAFATIAAMVAWMAFSYLPGTAKHEDKPATRAKDEVVAWLINVRAIEWADRGMPARTTYKAGQRLAFTKGLVKIRYATGATVVIEGPAEFVVGSGNGKAESGKEGSSHRRTPAGGSGDDNSGYLALGSLVARCNTRASKGFTIHTPSGTRLEDLGTEFGVEVDERGAAEFVVLSGKVDLISIDDAGSEQRVSLGKGQGAFASATGGRVRRYQQADVQLVTAMRGRLKVIRQQPAGSTTPIITPIAATSTTTIDRSRTLDATIDRTGLSGGGINGDILSETHQNNDVNTGTYWLSGNTGGNVAGEVLTFTLQSASDINAVHIWGYDRTGSTSRSIKNFDLSFSTNGGVSFDTTVSLGDLVGPTADPIEVETLPFAMQSGVTHLRITNITNFGDSNYVGLSEIRFSGPDAESESSTTPQREETQQSPAEIQTPNAEKDEQNNADQEAALTE